MLLTGMCRCPSTTPGRVSTSRSLSVSFCLAAKLRTCAWAKRMSSRSRLATWPIARSTSCSLRRKLSGAQLSNFRDSSRTAVSPRASTSARIASTVSRTLASAALTALASIPRLRWRGIALLLSLPLPGGERSTRVARRVRGFPELQLKHRDPLTPTLSPSGRGSPRASLYRLRIDRRAGAAGDGERRAAEEELVDLVLGAVLGQVLEMEDLAHAQPHGRDHHPVPRLVRLGGFVRPHLDAPGVGADRRDLLLVAPVAVLELHAGRVAARIAAPCLLLAAALHLAGADDDEIGASDRHPLRLGAGIELVVADALAVLEPVDATKARDVEQHAAPVHLVARVLDAEHVQALGIDQLGVVAVIGLVLVEDVAERVPVGRALHAQVQGVVGVAQLVPVVPAGDRVGSGREHLVDRIEAS